MKTSKIFRRSNIFYKYRTSVLKKIIFRFENLKQTIISRILKYQQIEPSNLQYKHISIENSISVTMKFDNYKGYTILERFISIDNARLGWALQDGAFSNLNTSIVCNQFLYRFYDDDKKNGSQPKHIAFSHTNCCVHVYNS